MSYYNDQPQGSYGRDPYNQPPSYGGPPQVPHPWVAEWDERDGRWFFVNRETGERTFQHPQPSYGGGGGGYEERGYGSGYGGQEQRGGGYEQEPQKKSHTGRNVALGAAAGLLGGALLMHEGEKVEEKWDDAKYDVENDVRDGVQDVENFPDNAARWTGEKVQEVEDIPQDVDRKWDNAVQDVEDVPDDVAGWAGRKVGDVESKRPFEPVLLEFHPALSSPQDIGLVLTTT
ncbi:WW domain-containing protein isoform 2 [Cladophialophora immunda]|nr:WW domain-containing protein isoform 2 [Cladophialophora immunda]